MPPIRATTTFTRVPTTVPFSCTQMPFAFVYPPPRADVPGQFSRCASLEIGAARRLAFSPDGRLIALVAADGIVRLVEVASRQVVAVLPPPRASIDFVAFEPAGRGLLTLASGEREVTLWRAADWTPVWTMSLPGHRYQLRFGGGVAFAPDGRSAIVSAGDDTFLLDAVTGAIFSRHRSTGATLDIAFGWGGRRVVVAEAATDAHCVRGPNGGIVAVLDGSTLAPIGNVANLGDYSTTGAYRGIPSFTASPTGDVVLVAPNVDQPVGLLAWRLSDATPLSPPGLDVMPALFRPDGTSVVVRENGRIDVVDLDGGVVVAGTPDPGTGALAASPDGRSIAIGGDGQDLLRVWDVSQASPAPVCGTIDPDAPPSVNLVSSLSGDGQYLAAVTGSHLRMFRIADGQIIKNFDADSAQITQVDLSPDAAFAVAAQIGPSVLPAKVTRMFDGAEVASLAGNGWWWTGFAFSPRGDRLYATAYKFDECRLYAANLAEPGLALVGPISNDTKLIGFSQGCPVLYDETRGAWRSCGGCDDPPIGGAGRGAVLSPDGRLVAIRGVYHGGGVTIWSMQPGWAQLQTIPQRFEESGWMPDEYPVALTSGGVVVTGADPAQSCYGGPRFETRVQKVVTGGIIDALPPDVTSVDREARTLAYGTQIWCAR